MRLGFGDHGLGNPDNYCINPHTDSRMRTPQDVCLSCASSGTFKYKLIKDQRCADAVARSLPHPAPQPRYNKLKLYWN